MRYGRFGLWVLAFGLCIGSLFGAVVWAQKTSEEYVVTMVLDQRGILARDRETKLFGGPSRYLPTGVYKLPDKPLVITVGPTDQRTMPQVVISDPILAHYLDGNKEGIPLKEGRNVIPLSQGGVVHLINESDPTEQPPVVTIEGGVPFTYFVLGEHTLEDWHQMLERYKEVPAIELVGKRVLITASYDTAKDIDDPVLLLQYIDEAIDVQNRVSGLDENDPDPRHRPSQYRQHMRENNSPGTYMYMFYNHTGYNSQAMKTILNTQQFTQNGWGPWHEFGHTYQQNPWKWNGVGEVTVNIYSLNVQTHFGNRTRLEQERYYDRAFAYFTQPERDYTQLDDLFLKLVMFWQLQLAFGEDFYPTLHRVYREMPWYQLPTTDHDKIQTFIVTSSHVAGYNLTPFYERWGLWPTEATKEKIAHLPELTRPIWLLTDTNAEEIMGALGYLAGVTLTDVTPVELDLQEMVVAQVQIAVDGEEIYAGTELPKDLTLIPAELTQGRHLITAAIVDEAGKEHHYQATFYVEHFHLVQPRRKDHGAERLNGLVDVIIESVLPPKDILDVNVALQRVIADLDGDVPPQSVHTIFEKGTLPLCFLVNTLDFEDGAYDLIVRAITSAGVASEHRERVVIHNWETLEDAILPPRQLSWFGELESLKTVDKSSGWVYAQGDRELFFGDEDRILRSGAEDEYLAWKLPNLYQFQVTLYATVPGVDTSVVIQVSEDAESWEEVAYESKVTPGKQWHQLDLVGTVPKNGPVHYLRVVLTGDALREEELQLGHVRLLGLVDEANLDLLYELE